MLGNDGSGGNDDHRPVELALEVSDELVRHLAESREGSVGDANEEGLALSAISLLVFNKLGTVDEHMGKMFLEGSIVDF